MIAGMAVTKVSVSLDEEAMSAARSAADAEGISLSAWLSRAAIHAAGAAEGRRAVGEFEAEHGPIPADARQRAREALDALGVGR
jgi:hypothetical protein